MQKDILIAIDGSVYSNQSLTYISTLFAADPHIHFHLCTWITAGSSIMPSAADQKNSLIPTNTVQGTKESSARRYLKKATEKLLRNNITSDRIHSSVHTCGYNFAAAIQQTAEKDLLDAVLIGRRGLNGISEMLMGSVSSSLFQKCHNTPLWIIDGEVQSKKFLVPVDGSVNSLMAIDHLCHIFAERTDIEICLFHCTAIFGKEIHCKPELFYKKWGKDWSDTHLSGTDCLFNGPQQLLLNAGIPEKQIQILPESTDIEEAHSIIREAKKRDCGTIVMGRRGKATSKGLFGGVSDRAIKHFQDLALWVVG
ncbi:universal stress protein UspA-like protein [Desulfocapsa sulfexigens DSM 10523]|uniref:Universal stress protein UspA-like protein n=1 Tax=Desulfocapsa sulfexigens (strain DSM 10523 / SB164P1) TaxID=1167006 RepID=M1PR57_DESSD|nr:universal stress protein [Desulfocapsa sulfexigens]AGF78866.1 universal stress protein UspA-like protein [Desulfocapsa sulfexigens DSM 10523]